MSYQSRGLGFSFIVHAAVLISVVTMNVSMSRSGKPLVIDFSIENMPTTEQHKTSTAVQKRDLKPTQSMPPERHEPQPAVSNQQPVMKPVQPVAGATAETVAENQAPVFAARPSVVAQSKAAGPQAPAAAATVSKTEGRPASTDPSKGHGGAAEGMKQSYLKEHFAYIRNIVQRKLTYPAIARKMGWEGRVLVSFVVTPDGHARDIKISEASGIELLDKNAVAAVENASPFPKPPVEALLVIPVSYKLQ